MGERVAAYAIERPRRAIKIARATSPRLTAAPHTPARRATARARARGRRARREASRRVAERARDATRERDATRGSEREDAFARAARAMSEVPIVVGLLHGFDGTGHWLNHVLIDRHVLGGDEGGRRVRSVEIFDGEKVYGHVGLFDVFHVRAVLYAVPVVVLVEF